MKPINQLFLAAAVAVAFISVNRVVADDARAGSPKAQELAASYRTVAGTSTDLIDRAVKVGSPKALEMAASFRKVPSSTPDLVDRSYAGIPKLKELQGARATEFQVAPVK
jgi:hypothetical protein